MEGVGTNLGGFCSADISQVNGGASFDARGRESFEGISRVGDLDYEKEVVISVKNSNVHFNGNCQVTRKLKVGKPSVSTDRQLQQQQACSIASTSYEAIFQELLGHNAVNKAYDNKNRLFYSGCGYSPATAAVAFLGEGNGLVSLLF